MASIFTRIINNEIPSIKVHEDNNTLAIMDIHPIQPGQILVIPKSEMPSVWDLPKDEYIALMLTAQKAGQSIRRMFPQKKRVALVVEGLEVTDHAHIKIYPFSTVEEFHGHPSANSTPSEEELKAQADKLRFN